MMADISGSRYPVILKLESSMENKSFIETTIQIHDFKRIIKLLLFNKKIVNRSFISSKVHSNEVFLYMGHWATTDLKGPQKPPGSTCLRQQGHPPVLRCW